MIFGIRIDENFIHFATIRWFIELTILFLRWHRFWWMIQKLKFEKVKNLSSKICQREMFNVNVNRSTNKRYVNTFVCIVTNLCVYAFVCHLCVLSSHYLFTCSLTNHPVQIQTNKFVNKMEIAIYKSNRFNWVHFCISKSRIPTKKSQFSKNFPSPLRINHLSTFHRGRRL